MYQQNEIIMNTTTFTVASKKNISTVTMTAGNFDTVRVSRGGLTWEIKMSCFCRRIDSGFWVVID